ncbi:MAG: adenylate kinase family protein [Methanomassiliicoccales archaeon]|nr:adenylate kinase family protein [Methanomassiliicoccales archaeon]
MSLWLFRTVIVAISGTPGTGKSTLAEALRRKGYRVIDVGDFARERGIAKGRDPKRKSLEVDVDELDTALIGEQRSGTVFHIGHLSHLLTTDLTIVLRCNPTVLRKRLKKRKWSDRKIRENVEAEACDVILIEALERSNEVFEIDTTDRSAKEVETAVDDILAGKREKYAVGNIDWSMEVLSWY